MGTVSTRGTGDTVGYSSIVEGDRGIQGDDREHRGGGGQGGTDGGDSEYRGGQGNRRVFRGIEGDRGYRGNKGYRGEHARNMKQEERT